MFLTKTLRIATKDKANSTGRLKVFKISVEGNKLKKQEVKQYELLREILENQQAAQTFGSDHLNDQSKYTYILCSISFYG